MDAILSLPAPGGQVALVLQRIALEQRAFGHQPGAACEDMLEDRVAVADRPELVGINILEPVKTVILHDPLTGIVVFVLGRVVVGKINCAIVFVDRLDAFRL